MLLEIIPSAENVLQKNHVDLHVLVLENILNSFRFFLKSIALFDLLADEKDMTYIFPPKVYFYDGCMCSSYASNLYLIDAYSLRLISSKFSGLFSSSASFSFWDQLKSKKPSTFLKKIVFFLIFY